MKIYHSHATERKVRWRLLRFSRQQYDELLRFQTQLRDRDKSIVRELDHYWRLASDPYGRYELRQFWDRNIRPRSPRGWLRDLRRTRGQIARELSHLELALEFLRCCFLVEYDCDSWIAFADTAWLNSGGRFRFDQKQEFLEFDRKRRSDLCGGQGK